MNGFHWGCTPKRTLSRTLRQDALCYLPVMARQEWIALLGDKGVVVGFLKGDGW